MPLGSRMILDGTRLVVADENGVSVVELNADTSTATLVTRLRDPSFHDATAVARVDDRYLVVNAGWNDPPPYTILERSRRGVARTPSPRSTSMSTSSPFVPHGIIQYRSDRTAPHPRLYDCRQSTSLCSCRERRAPVQPDRSTLRERALEALRSAITSGQYRPGDYLGEVELSTHLGVSRGAVREALRHLQQEGLVTAGTRNMLRVSTVSAKEIRELFRVRAALEGLAVAEIIASRTGTLPWPPCAQPWPTSATPRAIRPATGGRPRLPPAALPTLGELDAQWSRGDTFEGRIRVTIMNCEADGTPSMMARDRHVPIVEAIARGDVPAARNVVEEHMATAAQVRPRRSLTRRLTPHPRATYRRPGEPPARTVDKAHRPSLHSSRHWLTVNRQLSGIERNSHTDISRPCPHRSLESP